MSAQQMSSTKKEMCVFRQTNLLVPKTDDGNALKYSKVDFYNY